MYYIHALELQKKSFILFTVISKHVNIKKNTK